MFIIPRRYLRLLPSSFKDIYISSELKYAKVEILLATFKLEVDDTFINKDIEGDILDIKRQNDQAALDAQATSSTETAAKNPAPNKRGK